MGKGTVLILITGATGTIGQALVARLGESGVPFRAASRGGGLEGAGGEHVAMDFADPGAVAAAVRGAEVVFLNSGQHPDMAALQSAVVDAAVKAGVQHIVKVSGGEAFTGPDKPTWAGRAHAEIEAHIAATDMGWTFLRPRYFMQNLLGLAGPIGKGTLPIPLTTQRIVPVDVRNIADVAATILAAPKQHDTRAYDLSGPESMTFGEIADRLSAVLGRSVTHAAPPLRSVVAALAEQGAPDWIQRHIAEGMTIFATDPSVAGVSGDVELVTGRGPIPLDRFISDHKAAFEK
jgi:NAD(P)H dehydrogenase (quinone)